VENFERCENNTYGLTGMLKSFCCIVCYYLRMAGGLATPQHCQPRQESEKLRFMLDFQVRSLNSVVTYTFVEGSLFLSMLLLNLAEMHVGLGNS
jgi:hypothetical protein